MTIQLESVTIDSTDPRKLAEFWTKALDTEVEHDMAGQFILLARPDKDAPYVAMQRVPEKRAGKNRVHIDFRTDDRPGEVERLIGLGATAVAEHTVPGLTWTVLQDPEGNEFCVGSYQG